MSYVSLTRLIGASVTLGVGSLLAAQCFYVVPGGHRALIFDRGQGVRTDTSKGEGIGFLVPFWQWPIMVTTRITPKSMKTETQTKDIQKVKIGLRVLYRPDVSKLPYLYKEYGADYAQRVLPSIGNEVMKAVVARYDAVELITRREQVSNEIKEKLIERASHFYLTLQDVAITDLSFSPEFTSAVERKQIAQQDAEKARYVVQLSEQEKLAAIIKAEGEAEAARLITEATAAHGNTLVELRRIEAAKEIAATLSKSDKVTYIPSAGGNMLLNMGRT